jgi:heme/copper-type cytochrome/quinol oxidase subunit 2
VLPLGNILIIITSEDVIHRWAVPSIGIKRDANPGRLNSAIIISNTPGVFYGHCSEICGANHTYMPINVEITSFLLFKQ